MKLVYCVSFACLVASVATAEPAHADDRDRGTLLGIPLPLGHLEPYQVRARIASAGFDTSAVRLGVDLYRLEYRTIDPDRRPIMASGLVAVPSDHARTSIVVSFTHGTELARLDAPSTSTDSEDAWMVSQALIYASAGFVASLPDYLGMGTGPGPHPFMDVPSEASAALDMLRAVRELAGQQHRRIARPVLVTGFSQGSFAALGLARELGGGRDPWFRLGAVAPISGPYHWSQWVHDAVTGTGTVSSKAATVYLAYLSIAWNRLHQLYAAPSEWYLTSFADTIESMMDGSHPAQEVVFEFLPNAPGELFTAPALAALERPSGRLAAALRAVDRTCEFAAAAPVRMFAARGDLDVPIAFSRECRAQLAAHGSRVELVDVGDLDHNGSNIQATAEALAWFTALRDQRVCTADD